MDLVPDEPCWRATHGNFDQKSSQRKSIILNITISNILMYISDITLMYISTEVTLVWGEWCWGGRGVGNEEKNKHIA